MKKYLFTLFLALILMPPAQMFDLQAALDSAQPGQTVTIPPGAYHGTFASNGVGVSVEAHGATIVGQLTINGSDQVWNGITVADELLVDTLNLKR